MKVGYEFPQNPSVFSVRAQRIRSPNKLIYIVLIILIFGILLIVLNIYELHKVRLDHVQKHYIPIVEGNEPKWSDHQPVLWVHGRRLETGYLKHVFHVFKRLGYVVGNRQSKWDVLWSHDYPFVELASEIANLKPNQKVNHFPGSGYITNKVSLAVSKFDFIPKAFRIPDDINKLLSYTKMYPEKMWVQKSNNHRGIKILPVQALDLSKSGTFVQEYVSRPLLIDGRKFDIGVYTVLTSVDPLRVYMVDSDALFRFCTINYYPFDQKILDKYVVGDSYTPMWQLPSFAKSYKQQGYNFKDSFDQYLRETKKDAAKVWRDIKHAIQKVYLDKEKYIVQMVEEYKSRNFFELVRFDFVLDENLNVYLMEVNMSPNLSSAHFKENIRLYEHILFNILSVTGLATSSLQRVSQSSREDNDMEVSDADIQVFADRCVSEKCEKGCKIFECQLCFHCLNNKDKLSLKQAYLEHTHRGTCRRVFPPPVENTTKMIATIKKMHQLNDKNKLLTLWFSAKCLLDKGWCY